MAQLFPQPAPTTDAALALRRFEFVASAAQVLAGSLDYDATLRSVAELVIPELGDMCVIDIVEDGAPRRVAATHWHPEKMQLLHSLALAYPTAVDAPTPEGRVLATGRPEILWNICEPVIDLYTVDDAHADQIRALGLRSHLAVPLIARGAVIGVLGVGRTEATTSYDASDVLLTTQLAAHAALAVENALHHRRAQAEIEWRRQAEDRLACSERRFRAVLDQFPLPTQLVAAQGCVTERNRALGRLFDGCTGDAAHAHAAQPPWIQPAMLDAALRGEPQVAAARPYMLADGAGRSRICWLASYAYPVFDEAGAVQDVVVVHQDTTESHLAAHALRQNEERLLEALTAAQMTQWHWDFASQRIQCSDTGMDFWGLREASAEEFMQTIHSEDRDAVFASALAAKDRGEDYITEYRVVTAEGHVRWLRGRGRVHRDAGGSPSHMSGVTIDVTEQRRAEAHSRLLVEAGRCLGQSLDYEVTLANVAAVVVPAVADWYAVDLLSAQGTLERVSVAHPDPAKVELAKELFERYPPRRDSTHGAWNVIRTGEPEWAASMGAQWMQATVHDERHRVIVEGLGLNSYIRVPLRARGRTIGVLTTVYAESGRRYERDDVDMMLELAGRIAMAVDNAQLHTRLQAQDRRKDEFLAMLAHELRNPLAPIATAARLLEFAADDPSRVRYAGAVIARQAAHMTVMVDDLLDVSRVHRGEVPLKRELVDLGSAVAQALEQARPEAESRGHRLESTGLEQAVFVLGDRTRLTQIVANLLNNASRYTPDGGTLRLHLTVEDAEVVVTVSDTGIGISQEFLPHVFELFSQQSRGVDRHHGGLGLGLALVDRLVQLHDGRIDAGSEGPGRGATFTVRLPLPAAT